MVADTDIQFFTDPSEIVNPDHLNTVKQICCLQGSLSFKFNGQDYTAGPSDGVLFLSAQLPTELQPSTDFAMTSVFLSNHIIRNCMPTAQYGTRMILAQLRDPVLHMSAVERDLAVAVMAAIRNRFHATDHTFYYEILRNTIQTTILDCAHIQERATKSNIEASGQGMVTFHRFITMLGEGQYRTHRKVEHYANALFITAKYLSAISTRVSGHPAFYWIDFFTAIEVGELLQESTLTIQEISERLNFNSLSYFSHYVKDHFHVSPQTYRQRLVQK